MRRLYTPTGTLLFILLSPFSIFGNNWTPKANLPGQGRVHAFGFSIGNKGYIGGGTNVNGTLKDFWEWDQATNIWTQKADLGGGPRYSPGAFGTGTKGYICGGGDASWQPQKDTWEFSPATNTWAQKKDFGGATTYTGVGFSIGSKGYVGTGGSAFTNNSNIFWEYDPANNNWTQRANVGGIARDAAVGFSIGNKGYIGTGRDSWTNTNALKDFWEWDPATNVWTQKADLAGAGRYYAVGFGFSGKKKGYIGTGGDKNGNTLKDFWEWDQATNTWTQKKDYGGGPVRDAVGFSIGDKGYIGTGSASPAKTNPTTDFWEYTDTICTATANVSSDPSSTVCVGQAVYLTATGGTSYSWSTGATTANTVVHPMSTTTYTIVVTNAQGCTGSFLFTIPVDPNCNPTGISFVSAEEGNATVFPNPMADFAILTVPNTLSTSVHLLKLFDASGKEVMRTEFSGSELKIERGNLKEGIYFYTVSSGTGMPRSGKLLIKNK